ncbi:MAG: VOC family protein [Paracoccus sp. (in: a-proteobacteria)]
MSFQGNPCWFELSTGKGKLADAGTFYSRILGWQVADSGMPDFTYHLAMSEGDMVAGLMETPDDMADMPPFWMIYFTVDDCDQFSRDAVAASGRVFKEPADIPGTGRFAILADPQGAAFGVLTPDMSQMSPEERAKAEANSPFNQNKAGRGNWLELMSADPEAGFDFYARMFGWTRGEAMPMDEMGNYQLFRRNGTDIGGMMGLGPAPVSFWMPYFGINGSVAAMAQTITEVGGKIMHGPVEVPGPAWIVVAQDPQGAAFALVGPEN